MTSAEPDLGGLIRAHLSEAERVRRRVERFVDRAWDGLQAWREDDITGFVDAVVPVVLAGQRQIASLTDAYLARVAAVVLGEDAAEPAGVDEGEVTGEAVRGIPPEEEYQRAGAAVWTALSAGKTLDAAVEEGRRRAVSLAATDLQLARTHTSRRVLSGDDRVAGYRRVLTGSENCALCTIASTQRYHREQLSPIHPGCVPGSARVRARNVEAVTRRWYAGKMAVIATAAGDEVTVTPEHPVLTDRGWVPAREVREVDYLARTIDRQGVVGGGPDEGERPPFAEDVWRSFAMALGFVQVPLAAEDFHGDGADGYVDVVRTDGHFSTVGNPEFVEVLGEPALVRRQLGRVEFAFPGVPTPLVPGGLPSSRGRVRGGRLLPALLGGHLCRAHAASVRRASAGNVGVTEPSADDIAGDALLVGDDVLGEAPVDVVGAEFFDRVTDVRWFDFRDHVYNLQCRSGTYESDSHIVHNCDCGVAPIYGDHDPGQVLDEERLEQAHQQVAELAGAEDRGGRAPDYSDILIRDHGEYGPTLTWRDQQFTSAADL